MSRDRILGTAGHIDHGKTALVKALTGIDCDRLPEEKARGITIDIGFAHLPLGDFRLGIVDVPGHERFIRNMLAGATGIDLALLVVAADDSVMPQTREHLEILKLLGLRHGAIAITKCDLVDETTRDVVALEVRELASGTFLENAPLVFTSAHAGTGLDELRAALRAEAEAPDHRPEPDGFRMAIDRAFVVQGHGTVVTGSVASGSTKVGDTLDWHSGGGTIEPVRIRGLNQHGRLTDEVRRGQRAAINLAGVPLDRVRRGQELAAAGRLRPSRVLTVRLHATGRAIKHRLPVRLHVGTAEVLASVSLLDADRLLPGGSGLAQLFLETHVAAMWGQPLVVRDSSAEHTLGGGVVLQPAGVKLRRRHVSSLERLIQLEAADAAIRADADAWFAGFQPAGELHPDRERELESRVMEAMAELHAAFPLHTAIDRVKLLARFEYVQDSNLLTSAIERLLLSGRLVGDAKRFARSDFKPKLNANQRKLKEAIVSAHAAGRFQPPDPKSFPGVGVKDIYEVAVAEGFLVKLADDVYLHADADAELRTIVRERLADGRAATVAEIRDWLATSRKFAVPICEHLDRLGLTRRDGDRRTLA